MRMKVIKGKRTMDTTGKKSFGDKYFGCVLPDKIT